MASALERAIGLAKRAGQIIVGSDLILDALRKNKASLLLIASDISPSSEKKLISSAENNSVRAVKTALTKSDIASAIGSSGLTAAIAIKKHEIEKLIESALNSAE